MMPLYSPQESVGTECVIHMAGREENNSSESCTCKSSSSSDNLASDSEEYHDQAPTPTSSDSNSAENVAEIQSPKHLSQSDSEENLAPSPTPLCLPPSHYSSAPDFSTIEKTPLVTDTRSLEYPTFKLVGDNIDKSVKPRFMRSDHQTRLLHYFHHFAVKDRVDMHSFSETPPPLPSSDVLTLAQGILPSSLDNKTLKENLAVHISCILTSHMLFFADSQNTVTRYIPHKYSKEMAQKSTVVS